MATEERDLIKQRELAFKDPHPDPNQARTASRVLANVDGILDIQPLSPTLLRLSYNVLHISLTQIESALREAGLSPSSHLSHKIKRALYRYWEDTQRANNGCNRGETKCTKKIFAHNNKRADCRYRDPRPEHWRRYY